MYTTICHDWGLRPGPVDLCGRLSACSGWLPFLSGHWQVLAAKGSQTLGAKSAIESLSNLTGILTILESSGYQIAPSPTRN